MARTQCPFMLRGPGREPRAAVGGLLCGGGLTLSYLWASAQACEPYRARDRTRRPTARRYPPAPRAQSAIYRALAQWLRGGRRAAHDCGGWGRTANRGARRGRSGDPPPKKSTDCRRFLQALEEVLHTDYRPLLITGAGFGGRPRFRAVETQLGRGGACAEPQSRCGVSSTERWRHTAALYRDAKGSLSGQLLAVAQTPFTALYVVKMTDQDCCSRPKGWVLPRVARARYAKTPGFSPPRCRRNGEGPPGDAALRQTYANRVDLPRPSSTSAGASAGPRPQWQQQRREVMLLIAT